MVIKWSIGDFELGIGVFRIRDWGFISPNPNPKNTNPQFKITSWLFYHQLLIKFPICDFLLGICVFFKSPTGNFITNWRSWKTPILNSKLPLCHFITTFSSLIGCTLRSWVHEIFWHYTTVSPQLVDNYALKCTSDKFPHKIWITMPGKLSELHCNASLVSNRGEKVMKWRKIVGQICPIVFLAFFIFSPALENSKTSKCDSESFPDMMTYILCLKTVRSTFWRTVVSQSRETVL